MKSSIQNLILLSAGLLIFAAVILSFGIDPGAIISLMAHSNPLLIIAAIAMLAPMYAVKGWKWKGLIKMEGTDYPLRRSISVYWIGIFVGVLTPGRLGDFIKVFYLKKEKSMPFSKSFTTVFMDRLSDVILLLVTALISMYSFSIFFGQLRALLISSAIILALVILIFVRKDITKNVLWKFADCLVPKSRRGSVKKAFSQVYRSVVSLGARDVAFIAATTIFYWTLFFVQMHVLALALGIDISFPYTVICVSISTVFTMIPVSISGIGTRDAVFVLIFSAIGLSSEAAIGFSLMILFTQLLTAFIGWFFWLKNPLKISLRSLNAS